MSNKRFNPVKLEKLNNPERLKLLPIEFIIEKSDLKNPDIIIDLGAGTGLFSAAFAKYYPSSTVYATDISAVMVEWMMKNRTSETQNLQPLLMKDGEVGLEDEIGDFICMINLHHELDTPLKTLEECLRLLKPGGKIVISDWKKEETKMGPNVSIRVSPNEIEKQLYESGFKNVSISEELKLNYFVVAEK